MCDEGCICRGNWRELVKECEGLFGKKFMNEEGKIYTFVGLMHNDDDYYYAFITRKGRLKMASCVGDFETNGFKLVGA